MLIASSRLRGALELLEEAVRGEDGDADVAALVAADVRLPLLHPRQVVDVVERVALGAADDDVAVRDDVLAQHAVDEDRGVDVLDAGGSAAAGAASAPRS